MYFEVMLQCAVNLKGIKCGITSRHTFTDWSEACKIINKNNAKVSTISISVNPYLEVNKYNKVVYDTVYVKRLYFDLDKPHMDDVRVLAEYFYKKDIAQEIRFSGKGFHILPYVCHLYKNIDKAMMAVQEDLKDRLQINFCTDDNSYCRKDKLVRVPNTYNMKRKRYCIPLLFQDLKLEYKEIKEMARKQRFLKNRIEGKRMWDLVDYNSCQNFRKVRKIDPEHLNRIMNCESINEFMNLVGLEASDICPAIKYLINKKYLRYKERYFLIVYLYNICKFNPNQVVQFLKNYIDKTRFEHGHYFEKQPIKISEKGYNHNCEKCKSFGLCPEKCDKRWCNV